ncbi:uncharacterized protein [Physcomitrium patens]|uniref:MYND-type domain-containing protein n=1 Tax=Physcomitrium patens TaxID=3218 RepID=A0A2K1J3R9_PHYPA|nr:vicilin-like seed storage protein At2g18540 [Physcomitrium patens]XP_024400857.1 vicilin-like seed storage protein At2g18540 [Physcomitrium patens]PNR36179.1 hypothetical protein PHYPA_022030 [Physcomitrium patens]|eukprot:XP_024400856.1 vicilin-like seed storage protein At2g18540 [Physcomitrella patens]
MWELLDIHIPAVLLLPIIACAYGVWFCCQRSTKTSHVRRSEFQRLQQAAMREQAMAERELEEDYRRHKQVESQDFRRRASPGNGYGHDIGIGEWREDRRGYRDSEADPRRRKQVVEQEQHRRHEEAELQRRRQVEEDEKHRKREEADYIRRKEEADALRKQAEMEDRKRREEAENELRRQEEEEQEWQRRKADLEAQAKREAEEERRRRAAAAEEDARRRWKEEEAGRLETAQFSPRNVQGLSCVVCQKPTRRRCSRCKSISYCSRECQVKHWSDGHKYNCKSRDNLSSPRSSIDGDTF